MMNRVMIAMGALCLLAGAVPQAHAQQQQGFTPQELDRMSQQRMQATGPINHGPPPPLSSIPKQQIYQPKEPWICKGTTAWQPVYSAPSMSAAPLGKTMNMIAVGGRPQNGFARILFPNGKIGWVPAGTVHEYVSDVVPNATCSISGVRAEGGPIFSVQ